VVSGAGAPDVEWLVRANRATLLARLLPATVHDASNALQVMSGAAEMLALTPTPDEIARRATTISSQAIRAHGLLQQLTAFARADPWQPEPGADLRALCERVVELRGHALRTLDIDAQVTGPAGVEVAGGAAVMQAVLNLVLNAEQAAVGRRGAALRLVVHGDAGHGELRVCDDGAGLAPPGERRFAWPPAVPYAGTLGIGLLVSRALVARFDGTLDHLPDEGPGTTFRVRLPRGGGGRG
jgi:two-component system C4-dicarboxylate transport sensor histidine kinase DctB